MNEPRLPGFTAEASRCSARPQYHIAGNPAASNNGTVLPQLGSSGGITFLPGGGKCWHTCRFGSCIDICCTPDGDCHQLGYSEW
jgi:hypothetical protein